MVVNMDSSRYLSDGEIHYLWHFMQGTIMDPFVRNELWKSWGFCQRHTTAWLIVESAFFNWYLHGPSILLSDLIERAKSCFNRYKIPIIVAINLKNKKPCHMCDLGYTLDSIDTYANEAILSRGRNTKNILDFADENSVYWRKFVCPQCTDNQISDGILCRPHLIQELLNNNYSSFLAAKDFLSYLATQINTYSRSFRWEHHGTETKACKAALVTAAGWLNGWKELLNFINNKEK